MAKLPILLFPDPILRETAAPIERIDDALKDLVQDMLETMYKAPGVGLAAPQVGISRRLFVMDPTSKEEEAKPRFFLNPEIVERGDVMRIYEEGCLSLPDIFAEVERPSRVLVRHLGIDGEIKEEWLEGHQATVAQHEIDHLNGTLFIDHISRLKRDMLIRKFRKARRDESVA
ncbi:MAG: peptide deformylase [Rhodomicrobium sp.]|nr:peptide deformylase [Rhodomicrobium sp.]